MTMPNHHELLIERFAGGASVTDGPPSCLVDRILQATAEAVTLISADLKILWVNEAFTRMTGYSLDEIRGRPARVLRSGHHDEAFYQGVLDTLRTEGVWVGEMWRRRCDGEDFPTLLSTTALRDESGNIEYYVDFFNDVGSYKKHQQQLEFLVYHDALTKLPQWHVLQSRLGAAMRNARRLGSHLAMLVIDLDRFKDINDTYGHLVGDRLLCLVAERLKACVRGSDTVSRLGGDEFVVLVEGLSSPEDADRVVEHIKAAFRAPFMLEGKSLTVTASVGVSCYPGEADAPEALFGQADQAMYSAKRMSRNACCMGGARDDRSVPVIFTLYVEPHRNV